MKKFLSLMLVLVLVLASVPMTSLAIANPFGDAWVKTGNGKTVNVRRGPAFDDGNITCQLAYGSHVEIIGYEKGTKWALCKLDNGTAGYIVTRYLVRTKPGKYTPSGTDTKTQVAKADYATFKYVKEPYTVTVRPSRPSGSVNLRWAPDKASRSLQKYYQGAELTVIAEGKGWLQARDEKTGYTGFIMSAFVAE